MKDYYKILGVDFDADDEDIKRAYRKIALKYHPDKNSSDDATEKFIKATEAYEVLIDPKRREEYDSFYEAGSHDPKMSQSERNNYKEKEKDWSKYGREKAKEYASMQYVKFTKRAFQEVKIGFSYIPNLIAIIIVGMILIGTAMSLPYVFEAGSFYGFFLLLLLSSMAYLEYSLFNVLISDYKEDRNIQFD